MGAETGLLDQLASLLLARRRTCCGSTSARSTSSRTRWTSATGSSSRVDSGATHSIAASGYNQRRAECRAACEALGIDVDARRDDVAASRAPAKRAPPRGQRERARGRHGARRSTPTTSRPSPGCSTSRTPRCATTTRRPCPRSRPRVERLKAAGAAGARMVGGGFGGSVLALLPPGVARPAGALAVAPARSRSPSLTRPAPRPSGRVNAHSRKQQPDDEHPDARRRG